MIGSGPIQHPFLERVSFHRSGEGRGELALAAQYPSSAQQIRAAQIWRTEARSFERRADA